MSREGKIAWLSMGAVVCGLWALSFAAILTFAMAVVLQDTRPDTTGLMMTGLMIIVLILLPGFAAWKFFMASRRLSAQRHDAFAQKETFK